MLLNWILTPSHVEILLAVLALATPVGAGIVGVVAWRRRPIGFFSRPGFWLGAFFGPLVLGLWRVYNAIEDRFGLDSLAALGLNALIFLAVGAGLGLVFRAKRGS